MKEYEIKRGHFKNIEGEKLKELFESSFGNVQIEDEKLISTYGALQPIKAWVKSKNILCVDTIMNSDVPDEEINETIRRYNKFLESATGFNSKERVKRAKKKTEK